MFSLTRRIVLLRAVLIVNLLLLLLFAWQLAQASFWVQPTVYAPLAVKNLSPKRGAALAEYVSDLDYQGVTWFYNWYHTHADEPWWPILWDAPGVSATPMPTP
jgi:hypothetical protein